MSDIPVPIEAPLAFDEFGARIYPPDCRVRLRIGKITNREQFFEFDRIVDVYADRVDCLEYFRGLDDNQFAWMADFVREDAVDSDYYTDEELEQLGSDGTFFEWCPDREVHCIPEGDPWRNMVPIIRSMYCGGGMGAMVCIPDENGIPHLLHLGNGDLPTPIPHPEGGFYFDVTTDPNGLIWLEGDEGTWSAPGAEQSLGFASIFLDPTPLLGAVAHDPAPEPGQDFQAE